MDRGDGAGGVRSGAAGSKPDTSQPPSLADVTEHLVARFDGRIEPLAVARMVRRCNRELMLTQGRAAPDAVEHLALRRLSRTDPA